MYNAKVSSPRRNKTDITDILTENQQNYARKTGYLMTKEKLIAEIALLAQVFLKTTLQIRCITQSQAKARWRQVVDTVHNEMESVGSETKTMESVGSETKTMESVGSETKTVESVGSETKTREEWAARIKELQSCQ